MQQSLDFGETSVIDKTLKTMFATWVETKQASLRPLRLSSLSVYQAMWYSISEFFIRRDLDPLRAGTADIQTLAISLGGTPLYQKRILKLLEEVTKCVAGKEFVSPVKYVMKDPVYRLAGTRSSEKLPVTLNAIQEHELIKTISSRIKEGSWKRQRDMAMAAVILGAGIKPGEALALVKDQIRFKGLDSTQGIPEKLSLPGNGNNRARECPIAEWAAAVLATWLETRQRLGITSGHVFPADLSSDKGIAKTTFYRQFTKLLGDVGIVTSKTGAHLLRHTFAVRQLEQGRKLSTVKDWLGLEAYDSTDPYLKISRRR